MITIGLISTDIIEHIQQPLLDSSSVKIGGDITDKNMIIDLSKLLQQSDGRRMSELKFSVSMVWYSKYKYQHTLSQPTIVKTTARATVATGSM